MKMDKRIFKEGMKKLAAAFAEYELRDETLAIYYDRLHHLSDQDWNRAINHHIDTGKWFPKISELLEGVAARVQASFPKPIEVWNGLITAAERNQNQKPEMDAATERALRAVGGWEKFTLTSYDELKWLFKEFKEVYLAAREQDAGGRPELGQPAVPQIEGPG